MWQLLLLWVCVSGWFCLLTTKYYDNHFVSGYMWWSWKRPLSWGVVLGLLRCLTAESVQSAALSLQSVDNIHSGDCLPLGMLGVGDGITDDILKEHFENTTGLLIDETRDTLDTTSASKTADSGLGDTLDVITQDFAMTLSATLSESFSSFSTSRHDDSSMNEWRTTQVSGIYTHGQWWRKRLADWLV